MAERSSRHDVVIVGGGSAGCVLAARLTEDDARSVLLLEAGPDHPDLDALPPELKVDGNSVHGSAYNWRYDGYYTAGQRQPGLVTRGRVIGGSGSVNGSMFVRALPEDYDAWGSRLWGYDAVLPYLKKLETDLDYGETEIHGGCGPIPVGRPGEDEWVPASAAFRAAALGAGFPEKPDLSAPEGSGVGAKPRNDRGGVRVSASLAYLAPARRRPRLEVVGDAPVNRVLFDGTRAVGVEYHHRGRTGRAWAGEVVLCAGAIGSPQLLLLSGVGPGPDLHALGIPVVADLPGVGRNLRDHPVAAIDVVAGPAPPLPPGVARTQLALMTTAPGSTTRNDLQLQAYAGSPYHPNAVTGLPVPGTLQLIVTLNLPLASGRLTLCSSDPGAGPRLDFHYLEREWDRARLRAGIRLCDVLLDHPAWRGVAAGRTAPADEVLADDAALDRWLVENVRTASHSVGTCRMGPAERGGVVDERCRVHGLESLRVVDLSVVPEPLRANPNATALMIGERAADLL